MSVYAVIDTNVLVSAVLKPSSVPSRVIEHALSGKIIPLFNDEILAEYREVLGRKKFGFPQPQVEALLNSITSRGRLVGVKDFECALPDPKDKVFYCVLMTAREDTEAYLVTGNLKHFPQKIFVVTPREILDILEAEDD